MFCRSANATEYRVDNRNSQILFSGNHAGMDFSGRFEKWQADIFFDPSDLEISQFTASFNTATARTGDRTYDETLLESDWFDVAKHPKAEFATTSFTQNADGTFRADGQLTMRGITQPLAFTFSFIQGAGNTARLEGKFVLDRLAYKIGFDSDPKAEWVSREIGVVFMLYLNQQ